jgi:hypothetical protein
LAFAVALAVKIGVAKARLRAIPVKKHGRRARTLFALGLNTLRKIFAAATPDQIIAFLVQLLSPKLPLKPLLSLAFSRTFTSISTSTPNDYPNAAPNCSWLPANLVHLF